MNGLPNNMYQPQPQATPINVIIVPDMAMADQYPVNPGNRLMFLNEKMTEFRMRGRDSAGLPLPDRIWKMEEVTPPPIASSGNYVTQEQFKSVTDSLGKIESLLKKFAE